MIENFKFLIAKVGFIPNGNRLYYTKRSQPPVFAQIVQDYITSLDDPTTERTFIASVIQELEQEFQFWQDRMVNVSVGNQVHQLARYWVDVGGPRPGEKWKFLRAIFTFSNLQSLTEKTIT